LTRGVKEKGLILGTQGRDQGGGNKLQKERKLREELSRKALVLGRKVTKEKYVNLSTP